MLRPDDPLPEDVQALIFDCDGTLVDTMPTHYAAWCSALEDVGLVFPESRFYALAGSPTVDIVNILAREQRVTCDAVAVAHDKERRYLAIEPRGLGIAPVVAIARREHGRRKLAVASGGFTHVVRETLRGAGLEELFEAVVGAEQVARGKPAPDVFLRAAELVGVEPARCVVYEDAELGLEAARAAGMRAVDIRPWCAPRG